MFDLGFMHPGANKTVHVVVLHRHDGNRLQVVPVSVDKGKHQVNFNVRLDVGIRK